MEVQLREVKSIKKGIEVVLLFNRVEDLKGFKLCCNSTVLRIEGSSSPCSQTPRQSLEELEGFNLQYAKGVCIDSTRETLDTKCANTLKKSISMNTILSDDDKKSDSEDDKEDTETLAFNVIIDLENTSMHNDHKDDINDDSIYSDEEVSYEELKNKYRLLYTKWVGLVELHHNLKDSLKMIQE
ncbi:hypothetical protein M9H77_27364 [Catharanthus roseus]|uniref:Uncharacterized protein n=1 Tax=Catharanthus roseus TaxID=4058 RepID=A0ACC0ACV0_CATRO|nr:hypothetical protein M9H77_27364 [Catharanthus roseus]